MTNEKICDNAVKKSVALMIIVTELLKKWNHLISK